MGACPLWLDELEHDRWVAATSHLPYLLSNALAACTPLEAAPMAGPGFRSTTRLAAQPPALMLDILATNRLNVLEALRRLHTRLDLLEHLLEAEDYPALERLLQEGARPPRANSGRPTWRNAHDPDRLPRRARCGAA